MTKRIVPLFVLALSTLLFVGAQSCSGFGDQVRPGEDALGQNSTCDTDEDCSLISVDCCDCNMGGKQRAVLKSAEKGIVEGRKLQCGEIMCAAVISTDPSCALSARCVDGACVLK